jgi:hypothetical protein
MQDRPRPSVRSASIATLTALALGSTFAGGFAGTAYADSLPGQGAQQGITFDRVTICHATGSTSNPFVQITPSKIGVVNGHLNHQDAADIVPAFTYVDKGTAMFFAGQNLSDTGLYQLAHSCQLPTTSGGVSSSSDNGKVTLCHATGSATNPFVLITVDASGALDGHAKHGDDVIPAYDYTDNDGIHHVPAQNVDAAGSYELAHGCALPPAPVGGPPAPPAPVGGPPAPPAPVGGPPAPPAPVGGPPAPPAPVGGPPAPPAPVGGPPAPPAPGGTLTAPGVTSTAPEILPTVPVPAIPATQAAPKFQAVVSNASAGNVTPIAVVAASAPLPFTGDHTGLLADLGLALLASGAGALVLGRRRESSSMA